MATPHVPTYERYEPYLADPPVGTCTTCHNERGVKIVSRLEFVVYVRCPACGNVWSLTRACAPWPA
jgi:predicted RNA-binding Zn-ribbon protein involved in translation (DUF1610 family)